MSRRALLHNLRYDEAVASFGNASGVGTGDAALLGGGPRSSSAGGGACTAISFRTGACTTQTLERLRALCLQAPRALPFLLRRQCLNPP